MGKGDWVRVSRDNRCPVCGKPDWCLISHDATAAICARTESGQPAGGLGAGWVHELAERPVGPPARGAAVAECRPSAGAMMDWARLSDFFRSQLTASQLALLADCELKVSRRALVALGIGWCDGKDAFTFPMKYHTGEICGIRLRHTDCRKSAIKGSANGLFIPSGRPQPGMPILVCEGPTDTAAILSLGLPVVGRPNCNACAGEVVSLVKGSGRVIIVADSDLPGVAGAERLRDDLARVGKHATILKPADGCKDARESIGDAGWVAQLFEEVGKT